MNPNDNEAEIIIKDLILFVIKHLGIMILAGLLIGGGLGANKIIQRVKTNDVLDASTKLNDSETDIQYELRVQNIERARFLVDMISNINDQIENERNYIADSIYMQIDAEDVYQSTAQITLTLEKNDTNGIDDALFSAYEREVKAGSFLEVYAKKIGKKADYVRELVSFSSSPAANTIISVDSDVSRVGSMYISVIGPSRDFCDEVMELVINEVKKVYGDLNDSVAPHSLYVVGIQQIQKTDNNIRDGQISQTGKIDTLQKQIVAYNESLDKIAYDLDLTDKEEILEYFETHKEVSVDGIPTETSERNVSRWKMIKPGIKWAAVGFAGGVFVGAVIAALCYIFGKKIYTQAQFFGVFTSIRKIGVLTPSGKRSKFVRMLDKKSEDDTSMTEENNRKLISANYHNLTREYGKVLVTGTGDIKAMDEAVKVLGLKGDYKPDIFSNPDILSTISDYDAVVLMEQRKVSVIKTVTNEISLINNSGTPIIGAIII